MKNPHANADPFGKVYNGPYSLDDTVNWTPELKKALNYDSMHAMANIYSGVFWIDLETAKKCFHLFSTATRPEKFKHKVCFHG